MADEDGDVVSMFVDGVRGLSPDSGCGDVEREVCEGVFDAADVVVVSCEAPRPREEGTERCE